MLFTMTSFLFMLLLFGCSGLHTVTADTPTALDHEVLLDPVEQNFFLRWGFNTTHMDFEITAKTLGWLAVGISPNGGMNAADVLLAWVDDKTGIPTVQDRWLIAPKPYSPRTVNLSLDSTQDWVLVTGSQNATHTTVRAVRKLVTCDTQDRSFTADTTRLIFSMHPQDPATPTSITKHTYRGTRSLLMLSESYLVNSSAINSDTGPEFSNLDLLADRVSISTETRTMYFCSLIKLPTFTRKHHIVTTRPVINRGNEGVVHHMLAYICNDKIDDNFPDKAFDCSFDQLNPLRDQVMGNCTAIIATFGIGSEPSHYPPEAGYPLTPELSGRYVFLESHYDNPEGKSVIDSSGIALTITTKLRPHDAAIMMTGYSDITFSMMIPPQMQDFVTYSRCSKDCTGAILPPTGINVIKVFLHTHTIGQRIYLRHIRGGKELPPLAKDETYDFDYQESQTINPPKVILPGDELIQHCHYNSMSRRNVTFGGWGTPEEMCMSFVTYYPANPVIDLCSSFAPMETVLALTGTPFTSPPGIPLTPEQMKNVTEELWVNVPMINQYKAYMSAYNWTPEKLTALQSIYTDADYAAMCVSTSTNPDAQEYSVVPPNKYTVYHEPSVCADPAPKGTATTSGYSGVMFILYASALLTMSYH
ncbi:hypothetical protein RvY_06862 [Ramazzottius varieornatus]|uniref:DOMON domain-containing protein n=1 Tax=Ramazzottius varieornatus TaxID=947166 RepID=A0A1D1V020_RAMVA|nr:hypothetical protein RvY_06862 [Ramazzottius varieornatus]